MSTHKHFSAVVLVIAVTMIVEEEVDWKWEELVEEKHSMNYANNLPQKHSSTVASATDYRLQRSVFELLVRMKCSKWIASYQL
uniref:Uncharacterized protein n=1 Tax=Parascaris equorum TaxID=6256 RepID=A0A914RGA8_PAREQ